jgi:hypothetical protein
VAVIDPARGRVLPGDAMPSSSRSRKAKQAELLEALEGVFRGLGVTIRYEDITAGPVAGRGGLCRVNEEYVLYADRRLGVEDRVDLFVKELRRFEGDNTPAPAS